MELVFVYNARSGMGNAVLDYAHKVFNPSSYPCDLCSLTHNNLGERAEWKAFVSKYPEHTLSFYHIDEFESTCNQRFDYPIVLVNEIEELRPVLTREQLAEIKNVNALIELLEQQFTG